VEETGLQVSRAHIGRENASSNWIPSASYYFETNSKRAMLLSIKERGAPRHDQPRRAGGCVRESQTSWLTLGQWMSDLGCRSLYAFVVLLLIDDFSYFVCCQVPSIFMFPPFPE
jgi:hypothetical protein